MISKKKVFIPKNVTKSGVSQQKTSNLGLDLHSGNPEPVNFFRAQSLLGGAQFSFGRGKSSQLGGHGPGMLPRGAGSAMTS